MDGHGNCCGQFRGEGNRCGVPFGGKAMVSLVEYDPMGTTRVRSKLRNFGQKLGEEPWPFHWVDGEEIRSNADLWLHEQPRDLGDARLLPGVPNHNRIGKFGIITLRVDDAELKAEVANLLEQRRDHGRFA